MCRFQPILYGYKQKKCWWFVLLAVTSGETRQEKWVRLPTKGKCRRTSQWPNNQNSPKSDVISIWCEGMKGWTFWTLVKGWSLSPAELLLPTLVSTFVVLCIFSLLVCQPFVASAPIQIFGRLAPSNFSSILVSKSRRVGLIYSKSLHKLQLLRTHQPSSLNVGLRNQLENSNDKSFFFYHWEALRVQGQRGVSRSYLKAIKTGKKQNSCLNIWGKTNKVHQRLILITTVKRVYP